MIRLHALIGLPLVLLCQTLLYGSESEHFQRFVVPVLERRCLSCHNDLERKGGLALDTHEHLLAGGDGGAAVVRGQPEKSPLWQAVQGDPPEMPKSGPPLTATEIAVLGEWIRTGAAWPADLTLNERPAASNDWWSLAPLHRSAAPQHPILDRQGNSNPIDHFVLKRLEELSLSPSPRADRRTLIRRLYFDLHGLPPPREAIEQFENDADPLAYSKLVDHLLEQPQYGERWARHWLDVVHYADTHGYDKDKLRPNAWPYRDYVIRSLNDDKPYGRFLREQLAGDVLFPTDPDGVIALGFISAGPWDFVGHAEVPESKIDGQMARLLDRDDMVATTLNAMMSTTVQCARCHHHKFDPIAQEDYYSLQSVFAALDRADRPYDSDPEIFRRRRSLEQARSKLGERRRSLDERVLQQAGVELQQLDQKLAELTKQSSGNEKPEFGYHSVVEANPDVVKWVQIDLGEPRQVESLLYVACHDPFNNIGAGFGFPLRFKIEAGNDEGFAVDVRCIVDQTDSDLKNPGVVPQTAKVGGDPIRFLRITATRLAPRQGDYIFAIGELMAFDSAGANLAKGSTVSSLDSIEAPVRWTRRNLVDGYYYGIQENTAQQIVHLQQQRSELLARRLDQATTSDLAQWERDQKALEQEMAALPERQLVYAGTVHQGSGAFTGTGAAGGKPREIRVLRRGDLRSPGRIVSPAAIPLFDQLEHRFRLPDGHSEGERRAALAEWVAAPENGLTWRSIVNRVWQYHFGKGLVDSPNDFGRMGQKPTHPELLDWLAAEFRDQGQSLKWLHRLICNSSTYQQSSQIRMDCAVTDANNQLLWRANRRRLEAEAIRDSVLQVAGKLNPEKYGPGFWDFVLEKPEHSPHYEYDKQDPDDPKTHRRSIYRFIVRSAPDPFMETLDCADPSLLVDKRNETINSLSALTMLNNKFMIRMSQHFAALVEHQSNDVPSRIAQAFQRAIGRAPTDEERESLAAYANQFGLANACRVILNLSEFTFID